MMQDLVATSELTIESKSLVSVRNILGVFKQTFSTHGM